MSLLLVLLLFTAARGSSDLSLSEQIIQAPFASLDSRASAFASELSRDLANGTRTPHLLSE